MPFSATRDLWLVLKARDEGTRAMRSFSRDIRMVGDSVEQANLQAARSALRNQLAMQRMTGASKADQIATMNRISAIDREIAQSRIHRASLEESRVSAQKLSTALGGASATMIAAGTGMLAAGVIGTMGLKSLVDSAISYQKQSSLTRTQVDKFATSLSDIEAIGLRVANSIGVPFQQIQPALFDIFSSMEIGAKDAEKLLGTFAKAAVAGQTDISSASRATIGIMNAFQLPLTSVNHLMDLQFQLVKEGVGTYEEWTQRIGLVSPSAVRAGQSVEMMTAALAVTTRMGISAARSGTAVSRAMDAMSNPKAVAAMKALGVNALDATGHFRPMIDVLLEFRTALEKVPQADKIATILDVFRGAGGTIEARRFLQNMLLTPGNLELFKKIFQTMSTESGSFEQAYSIMADTAAAKSELLANKWQTLKVKAGEALVPAFIKVVAALGAVFDWFNKLDPQVQKVIATVLALGVGLSLFGGVALLILGTIAALVAAVVVAGSALFITVGILAAVTAAFAIFAAAIAIAWAKSATFRGIITDTGKKLQDFWKNYIIPTGQAIKDAWEKHMQPAFSGLATIVRDKVMPVLRDLESFVQSQMVKAAMELGNNIKDGIVFAFKILASLINSVVIPAIEKLTKFYHDHEDTIKGIITVLAWFTKWLLKIGLIAGGILAVILAGPVVVAFLAVAAVIAIVIGAIILLVEGVKSVIKWFGTEVPKAWNWLVGVAKTTWQAISDFFVTIWGGLVSFFTGFWNGIVAVWNSFSSWLSSAWAAFWNGPIGQLVISIWNLIVATVQLAIAAIMFVVLWGMKIIQTIWNTAWADISLMLHVIWDAIKPYLTAIWAGIVTVATVIWNGLVAFFTGAWNLIKNIATGVWASITTSLSTNWNNIVAVARAIWSTFSGIISNTMNTVHSTITSVWKTITDFFSGAGKWLWDAGRNIIKGLIDGIKSMIDGVTSAVQNITKNIRDHFPHSPAKLGPLAGKGGMFYAGQNMVKQLEQGISSKIGIIANVASLAASASGTAAPSLAGSVSTDKTINQQIIINTQEVNPRRHAIELGWLLAGRA